MKEHAHISELKPHEVSRFRAGFIADVKDRAFNVDGAVSIAQGKLTTIDPASVEYALALTALVTEENETMRRNFAYLMRFIAEIRPPSTGGKMRTSSVPEKFKGQWPHERLGHSNWTAYVTTKVEGEIDGKTREFRKPPGLGWSKQYESNLHKGYERIRELVGRSLPDARPEDVERRVDEVAQGAGADATMWLGGSKVVGPITLEGEEAAKAVASLAAGAVTADDIRERGTEALTQPRPKRQRSEANVDSVVKTVRRWNPQAIRELIARLEEVLAA